MPKPYVVSMLLIVDTQPTGVLISYQHNFVLININLGQYYEQSMLTPLGVTSTGIVGVPKEDPPGRGENI